MPGAIQTRPSPEVDLAASDIESISRLLLSSRSAETRRSYASAMRTFTAWCEERGYPSNPSTSPVVAAYVAFRAERVAHATIARDLAAISAIHLDNGRKDPTGHHGVRQALRSVGRAHGTAPTRRAAPVTTESMRSIIAAMEDREQLAGKRDIAILLLGLAAALRRSELATLTTDDIALRDDGMIVRISRSKTDQSGKGEVIGVPYGLNPDTCPVMAVAGWLEASGRRIGDSRPLFSRIYNHSSVGPRAMSDRSVARILQARARDAGVEGDQYAEMFAGDTWISGHSLRAGHATSAAAGGADAVTISRTTRHKRLDTLAKYIRPQNVVQDSTAGRLGL